MGITHSKVSTAPAASDPDLVDGPDWNADHVIALVDADIPPSIARDSEVTSAVAAEATARGNADTAHAAASDPHPGYTTAAELAAYAQPIDSDLTAIAALSTTSFGRALLALADQAALLAAAGASASGHDHSATYQPLDSDLTAIAALTTTSYGRAFLALADAAAARAALSLGTAAVAATGDFDAAGAASTAQAAAIAAAASDATTKANAAQAAAIAASQPVDSDLTAIAALSTTSFGRGLLALADAAALRTSAGLVIGTDVRAQGTGDPTRASLGLATSDSPEFAAVNVGAATDTTITRTGAGEIAVEGNRIFRVGGADVPVADGGTGASDAAGARTNLGALADPTAARGEILRRGASAVEALQAKTLGKALIGDGTDLISKYPPGYEWDFAQITAGVNPAISSNGSDANALLVVAGNAVTYDGEPVEVKFCAPSATPGASANAQLFIHLFEGSTHLGRIGRIYVPTAAGHDQPLVCSHRFTPSAAAHTYSIKASVLVSDGNISAGAGGVATFVPAYMSIKKV